ILPTPGQGDRLPRLHRLARQRAHAPADRPMDRSDRVVFHGPLRHWIVAPGGPSRADPALVLASWPWPRAKEGSRRSRRRLTAALAQPTFPWGLGELGELTWAAERAWQRPDRRGRDCPGGPHGMSSRDLRSIPVFPLPRPARRSC